MDKTYPGIERHTMASGAGHCALHDAVVILPGKAVGECAMHERASHAEIARRLAAIKGCEYAGEFRAETHQGGRLYFVPSDTLVSGGNTTEEPRIDTEHDLFGGVVPHAFVATKTITHGLPGPFSAAPDGWSPRFASKVREVVLPGYSAFHLHCARDAGTRLLECGSVRIKKASGIGGLGQWIVRSANELDDLLYSLQADNTIEQGIVLECNLTEVTTLSVGQVKVGSLVATYYGVQKLTRNNRGEEVYGGSSLTVARGDFDALLALKLSPDLSTAVSQACTYHNAAASCFPHLFASRCNYDVAQGMDERGQWRSGVLEQSWRVGGASGAEVAALEAFHADPALQVVRASTAELYGPDAERPDDAVIYFEGHDDKVGPILKYARLEDYAHT